MDGDEALKSSGENLCVHPNESAPSSIDAASSKRLDSNSKFHPIVEIKRPASNKRPSTGNKSGSKPLSVSSMLKRYLTANDDIRSDTQRNDESQSIDDIRFEREDALLQSVTDSSSKRSNSGESKVQKTR